MGSSKISSVALLLTEMSFFFFFFLLNANWFICPVKFVYKVLNQLKGCLDRVIIICVHVCRGALSFHGESLMSEFILE